MSRKILLTLVIAVSAMSLLGPIGWIVWTSTPQCALLTARESYRSKNQSDFNRVVDVANMTTSFTEEVLYLPAEETPGLTRMQRVVGLGALRSARSSIDNSLIFQVQNLVRSPGDELKRRSLVPDAEDEDDAPVVDSHASKIKDSAALSLIVKQEWKKEKQRLKDTFFRRMNEYAASHPTEIISRIVLAPRGKRAESVKGILQECGFLRKNYRSYKLEPLGPKYLVTLVFFSPRINDNVDLKLELRKSDEGPLGHWHLSRFVDTRETLNKLGFDTDKQVQDLIAYSLDDVNRDSLASEAKNLLRNIGESVVDFEARKAEQRARRAGAEKSRHSR